MDQILETSKQGETKFMALKILEDLIRFRWRKLPAEQREAVRNYIVKKVIGLSQDEASLRSQGVFLKKLDLALVHVLKHDWPHNWPNFIPDIVSVSKTSETVCENNMSILKLLSEDVFDFSNDGLMSQKAEALKANMTGQFQMIFELCDFILQASTKVSLIVATLQTLQRFVTWIPDRFIFESPLLPTLCSRFLPVPHFRVDTLMVIIEVSALVKPQHNRVFEQLYVAVIDKIVSIVPAHINIKESYQKGSEQDRLFLRHLALFLTTFFKAHSELLETDSFVALLMGGMDYLVKISDIDDIELFKICLDYWQKLASDLYKLEVHFSPAMIQQASSGGMVPGAGGFQMSGALNPGGVGVNSATSARKLLYAELLTKVREVMIFHMAKPEDVLIEENERGEVVKEFTKDTEALAVYKNMRDALVFLTHLDPEDTKRIMLERLYQQTNSPLADFNRERLNTLSWSIGSVSGTMSESEEKSFLVKVIKELLGLCDVVKGKDNKAVVASAIMYVVGQYPRFLRAHWKFLKTVVVKLFEFMHEKHPGVQDMAVETFLKIAQKCKKKFVQLQSDESTTFCEELCRSITSIVVDLEMHQVLFFYEAAGTMISAHPEQKGQYDLVERLLAPQNDTWSRIILSAKENSSGTLMRIDVLKDLQRILRINGATCKSVGAHFDRQLGALYLDMLKLYEELSRLINSAVASGGEYAAQGLEVKALRLTKRDILLLIRTFLSKVEDTKFVALNFIPPLLQPVLNDYASSAASTRDAEVLNLLSEIINTLGPDVRSDAPKILEAVFEPTLQMITANFQDYPEHRKSFFKLLEAINRHCFVALFQIPPAHTKLVVDSVVWAFKHTAMDIGEMGLEILDKMLTNVASSDPELCQSFLNHFFLVLVYELIEVLTDRLHKSALKYHATILLHLFKLVEGGRIIINLSESPFAISSGATAAFQQKLQQVAASNGGNLPQGSLSNQNFVREFVRGIVVTKFPNLSASNVQGLINGLFDGITNGDTKDVGWYKSLLRDFLLKVLEFGDDDPSDSVSQLGSAAGNSLYAEERSRAVAAAAQQELERRRLVPGLLGPYAKRGDDDDDNGDDED